MPQFLLRRLMRGVVAIALGVGVGVGVAGCTSGAWNLNATVDAQTPGGQLAPITADFSAVNGYSTTGTPQTGTLEIVVVDSNLAVKHYWTEPFTYSSKAIDVAWTVSWNTTGFATGQYGVMMNVLDNTGKLVASAIPAYVHVVQGIGALLGNYTPAIPPNPTGAPNEGIPNGVPSTWDWATGAGQTNLVPDPPPDTSGPYTGVPYSSSNYWGLIYREQGYSVVSNTQVQLANCQYWVLPTGSNTWSLLQDESRGLQGGNWTEDFSASAGDLAFLPGTASSPESVITPPMGENAHFWPAGWYVTPPSLRAAVTVCRVRLVVANASLPDNRASARYLLEMGADWRHADSTCHLYPTGNICSPIEDGKFIRITSQWRDGIMSTMSSSDLQSLPLPPASAFVLPDGTYPSG